MNTSLSKKMIETLKHACYKQSRNIPFGPGDIDGSFLPLISRGLIENQTVTIKGRLHQKWVVTKEAVQLLAYLGMEVEC